MKAQSHKKICRRLDKSDTGVSMTEFAIVLPVFALFLFGVIQFGLIFSTQLALRNATSVAARFAVLGGAGGGHTESEVKQAAVDASSGILEITTADVTVADETVGGESAKKITITYDLDLLLPFVVPGQVNGQLTLRSEAFMR